jgi:hypothetical protein
LYANLPSEATGHVRKLPERKTGHARKLLKRKKRDRPADDIALTQAPPRL